MAAGVATRPPGPVSGSGTIDRPPAIDDERGGGSAWVELTKARDDIDAHLLIGRLEEGGIETRTLKDRTQPGAWLYGGSNPWAPVTILVRTFELDSARLMLAELAFATESVEPRRPPPTNARRRGATVWWTAAILLSLTFSALILAQVARMTPGCQVPLLCSDR